MSSLPLFDVVIFGATPAGIAAAVRCARDGLKVALVHPYLHLGGMLTSGLGLYDTSFFGNRAPLVEEVFALILDHYARQDGIDSENYRLCQRHRTFEPHVAERVLSGLVEREDRITVLREWILGKVERRVRLLEAIHLEREGGGEELRVTGHIFLDCSYEGDLAAAAGVPYRVGRESRADFGEPHAGRIFTRYEERSSEDEKFPFAAAHGFIKLRPFDLCTGRIFPGSTGEGDAAIMAYNYRLFLSLDPENQAPIPPPLHYRRENYLGLLLDEKDSLGTPYPVKSKWLLDDIRDFQFRNHRQIPNRKISWNHGTYPGRNHAYPDAAWPERRRILAEHREHELGLLWFLQNDPEVPPEVRSRARQLGLARDEFVDNGNFPWEIYVREARRIVGRAVFTELDASIAPALQRARPHADSIAITDWMMDSHECTTERVPGSAYEGAVLLSELTSPGQVPYRCLLPEGLDNLLVPVCLSATHIGWGTIRVEPTWMHIAESAAIACGLSRELGVPPAAVPIAPLQRRLVEKGVMVSFFNECDMGRPSPELCALQFFGTKGFFPSYDAAPDALLDRATAQAWIEGFCAMAAGQLDAYQVAKSVAQIKVADGATIPFEEFKDLLGQQLNFALSRDPRDVTSRFCLPSPHCDPAQAATRGQACILLYTAAQLLFP